jgi:hypothetical protein
MSLGENRGTRISERGGTLEWGSGQTERENIELAFFWVVVSDRAIENLAVCMLLRDIES